MSPELICLRLRDHHWINEDTISKIGYFATNLKELSLEGLSIHDETLIEIVNTTQHVTRINISNCPLLTSKSIDLLLEKKHEVLDGFSASKMEDKFSEKSKMFLGKLKHLSSLDLSLNPSLLNPEVLGSLAQGNQKLSELNLAGCKELEEKAMAQIISTSKHHLTALDLSHCTFKGGDGSSIFQAMHGVGPNLISLRLCDSEDVNDSSISSIFHKSNRNSLPLHFTTLSYFGLTRRFWRCCHQQCSHFHWDFKLPKCL